jgi:DNA-binding transcriptional ArsR family regulator
MEKIMAANQNCCSSLEQWMPPKLFKALSDPNRIAILARLAENGGEMTVSEVARHFPIDLSVVSRHLGLLRDVGIMSSERRGKEIFYRVRFNDLVEILRKLAAALESCCPDGICTSRAESSPSLRKGKTK